MVALLLALACSDTLLSKGGQGNDADRALALEPSALDFGTLRADETAELSFQIHSRGTAALHVEALTLDDGPFVLAEPFTARSLAPGESVEVAVRYAPRTPADRGELRVFSDGAGAPSAALGLTGALGLPRLEVEPETLLFPSIDLCRESQSEATLTLKSVGEDTLRIEQFLLMSDEVRLLTELPAGLELEPGEELQVQAAFEPTEVQILDSQLWLQTNETAGSRLVPVSGRATFTDRSAVTDSFRQPDGPWDRVDLVFFVDRSCSMEDDEENVARNFPLLVDSLDESGVDWQAMISVVDNGCHSAFFDRDTADTTGEIRAALAVEGGALKEAGLSVLADALERSVGGGCNAGFLRERAKTVAVAVSDEPEQSVLSWDHYLGRMQAVAPTLSLVAVVGDLPRGCATAAPGTGYVEAALAGGGLALSICESDWGRHFDRLAELITGSPGPRFALSAIPDPATLQVTVDGEIVTDFVYEAETNEVVLATTPAGGALVLIDYDIGGGCED